jgi:pimeloyl-ACP methyl ester carboxylesterase
MKPIALLILTASAALAAPCLQPNELCSERLPVGKGHVTVYRTHPLTAAAAPEVKLAYVMVHGTNRNASEYFAWTLAAAAAAAKLDTTAVAALHFKARTATGGDAVNEGELYWTNEGWKSGESASNGAEFSYDAMNAIVRAFADRTRFPNLEEIVVAGHSAGGQYVQRYAATNLVDPIANVKIRYVVANPSSYVYMNDLRLSPGGSCSEKGGCTGQFVPYSDAQNCTTYNQYRFGLDRLTGFAALAGPDRIRTQFAARRVYYLVGELDTNTADPTLDKSCPAQAQGPNRRERGLTFWNHVTQLLSANHKLGIAPGCGHSAVCVFAGPAGVRAVFSPFE